MHTVFIPALDHPYSVDTVSAAFPDDYAVYKNCCYIGGFEYKGNGIYWPTGQDGLHDHLPATATAGEAIDLIVRTFNGE